MPTPEEQNELLKRLTVHRAHLRARRLSACFYKRDKLEAKVYLHLAKVQPRIEQLERQLSKTSGKAGKSR